MSDRSLSRRQYLTSVGGAAVTLSVAGCMGDGGSGNGDGGGGNGSAGTEQAPSITAGTAPGFPPFEMKEGGELVGFDIDLFEAVVSETEYRFDGWSEFEFDSLIPALTNNNIDAIAAGMTINEKRDQTIDFTDPYYSSDQAIVVREDGDFSPGSLSDLADRPVGAQKGTTGEGVVQDELVGDEISENQYNAYDNYVLAIQDLQNGNVDAVVIDVPVAETFAKNRPVEIAFVYETGEKFGFGVRTDDDELTSALNSGLSAVRESGRYEELTQKWFGE
ncbi:basic amino acid ABC transporter substrate-binding protein [Haloarcula nitratireducens]|uniref:Basic amino acid ABC transporter substrate-binding protein n=1 Tax=Haloarcula nitratireducens TaxID=2487749 RepID=A0AAW4PBF3_9EURY|nr:basic amino acid ABC transporter substrate-binding protein [Halomicroarcula nitratireducens]MBX0294815.1 basic amino acid ABC transporter substrate-binding protein [Halomicroarcula nitratireducens]